MLQTIFKYDVSLIAVMMKISSSQINYTWLLHSDKTIWPKPMMIYHELDIYVYISMKIILKCIFLFAILLSCQVMERSGPPFTNMV